MRPEDLLNFDSGFFSSRSYDGGRMVETLAKYRKKRDFNRSPEPGGMGSAGGSGYSFVIHEHHARRLHFDLRLEMNGVLKSWAVPKGPSLDPHDKRLAVQTEDHPLDYLTFEGSIPEGNYGAGEVAVWDIGTYEVVDPPDPEEGVSKGKLSFKLKGDRLCGEFHLVRTGQAKDSWLLMKRPDECANAGWKMETILNRQRSIADVANTVVNGARTHRVKVEIGRPAPFPDKIAPMLATPVDAPFDDVDWLFEVKWDGYRSLCYVDGDGIRFLSRNRLDLGKKFPELVAARAEIAAQTAVTLSEEDLDKFASVASRAIAMQEFVDTAEIDAIYLDKAYYLGPDEAGRMPYALLLEALKRAKKVGVAKMVMRDKEYLALIRPVDQVLVLNTMHYPDEIRQPEGIGLPSVEVKLGDRELEMADLLVKSMSGEFQPAEFQDTYREELLAMIRTKAEGAEYQPVEAKLLPTNVVDLVARLKASIEQAEGQKKTKKARG